MASAPMDSFLSKSDKSVRWAVVGTGSIAASFAADIRRAASASLDAVCSRDASTAAGFAQRFGPMRTYVDLATMAEDSEIDAVYVASPNSAHAAQVDALLSLGKPVLCEKTLTTSLADTEGLIAHAQTQGLLLMEGLWLLYLPAITRLRQALADREIGEIRAVRGELAYHKPFNAGDRFYAPDLGGGALLDLGIYPIALTLSLFGQPLSIDGSWSAAPTGVDASAAIALRYAGFQAALSCSFERTGRNLFVIEGETGTLILDGPFLTARRLIRARGAAARLIAGGETVAAPPLLRRLATLVPGVRSETMSYEGSGLQFEIEAAGRAIRGGLTEEPTAPLALSRSAATIIETIRSKAPRS
ncbi:Gfo/Idh/MocA family protein [Rhizobium sp. YIM 134829]|uniref:Gfo/Idh/MocA family protein n=1 Tax=Rhizobium sp. YIM 134829 TaxID=3390453 RepID=UPI00397D50BC